MNLELNLLTGRLWDLSGMATGSILFCFIFVKGPLKWHLIGKTRFSVVPPSNSLISVSDPWRAFWADMAPFKGPRLASCVASGATEIQGHCQVFRDPSSTPSRIPGPLLLAPLIESIPIGKQAARRHPWNRQSRSGLADVHEREEYQPLEKHGANHGTDAYFHLDVCRSQVYKILGVKK